MFRAAMPLALALSAVALPAMAQQPPPPPPPHARIMVSGEGESAMRPDMAMLSLGVMREAATAREAMTGANEAMAAVIAAMKEAGIADRDLQTSGLQINPRYDYGKDNGGQPPAIVAYQVSNTLSIRVRDIAKVGEVIDRAVTLGANQGGGISFTNEDPAATVTEARKKAVADAVAKARTLAEAAGVPLGRILEITEQSFVQPPMPFMVKAEAQAARDAVPIEAGENAYRVQVNVTFEIGPR